MSTPVRTSVSNSDSSTVGDLSSVSGSGNSSTLTTVSPHGYQINLPKNTTPITSSPFKVFLSYPLSFFIPLYQLSRSFGINFVQLFYFLLHNAYFKTFLGARRSRCSHNHHFDFVHHPRSHVFLAQEHPTGYQTGFRNGRFLLFHPNFNPLYYQYGWLTSWQSQR